MPWTLVTGGAKRTGAAICRFLAEQGFSLVIHYNKSKKEAEGTRKICQNLGVQAEILQGDFSTQKGVEDFIFRCKERYSTVQNIVNNVGNLYVGSSLQTPMEVWQQLHQVNVWAPIALSQAFLPSLLELEGSIINLGVAGLHGVVADTSTSCYRMTKLSLWMWTKSLAKELAPKKVRVNMVSPGRLENSEDPTMKNKSLVPMGRDGKEREVAEVVAFLLDKKNVYITGQNIEVAGGVRL